MKRGHGDVWWHGYKLLWCAGCLFIDWKVASKTYLKSGPEPSVSHYWKHKDWTKLPSRFIFAVAVTNTLDIEITVW